MAGDRFFNLISLNGIDLTDDGRLFNESNEHKVVDIELANGGLRRYHKANKKTFSFSWDWCPNADSDTRDGLGARDTIRSIALAGTSMTLGIRRNAANPNSITYYTVLLSSYSEELLRRDIVGKRYLYNVKLDLVEV